VNAYPVTINGNATIESDRGGTSGSGITHTLGTLNIGANTLSATKGGAVKSGSIAGLTFGNTTFDATPPVFDVANEVLLTLNALQNSGAFTKQGSGEMKLTQAANAARTTGIITLLNGLLTPNQPSALGNPAGVSIHQSGGTLDLDISSSVNAYPVTINGNATIESDRGGSSGPGIPHVLGALSIGAYTLSATKGNAVNSGVAGLAFGATILSGAAVFDVGDAIVLLTLPAVDNGGHTFTVQGIGNTAISGIISAGGGITKAGAGTLTLSGANTYSGATTINGGTLKLGAADVIPNGANKGDVTVTDTTDGDKLDLNTHSETINGLSGAGIVDTVAGGSPILTVGANDQSSAFSGVIKNTAGTLALTKIGTGTLTLSGVNTYAGATTVDGGTLLVNNPSGSGTGSGAVTVNNTGTTLGGVGTVGGTTIGSGAKVAPGNGAIGTLHTGALIFNAGSAMVWEFDASSADLVVAGALSFATVANDVTIYVKTDSDIYSGEVRTLFTFTGGGPTLTGLKFDVSQAQGKVSSATARITGQNVEIVMIPEPGMLALAGLLLIGLRAGFRF
ncbi:MAG: autotransporter-associated beta strand repeat-containing protein, partial [bacterium]|nr:autotransporter-associated beta strand repeat-containing protein [bacterium]